MGSGLNTVRLKIFHSLSATLRPFLRCRLWPHHDDRAVDLHVPGCRAIKRCEGRVSSLDHLRVLSADGPGGRSKVIELARTSLNQRLRRMGRTGEEV